MKRGLLFLCEIGIEIGAKYDAIVIKYDGKKLDTNKRLSAIVGLTFKAGKSELRFGPNFSRSISYLDGKIDDKHSWVYNLTPSERSSIGGDSDDFDFKVGAVVEVIGCGGTASLNLSQIIRIL